MEGAQKLAERAASFKIFEPNFPPPPNEDFPSYKLRKIEGQLHNDRISILFWEAGLHGSCVRRANPHFAYMSEDLVTVQMDLKLLHLCSSPPSISTMMTMEVVSK